jgi:hypothetical protein
VREGYNMGRKYFLRAETREDIEAIARELTMGVEEAKRRADKRTWFEKSQARVKALYDSSIYLNSVSLLLILVTFAHARCVVRFVPR